MIYKIDIFSNLRSTFFNLSFLLFFLKVRLFIDPEQTITSAEKNRLKFPMISMCYLRASVRELNPDH